MGRDVEEDHERRTPLQAVLLADSFTTRFKPITLEKPKVLLPVCGVPLIDYTLEWLESSGVEAIYVFCCAHSDKVVEHLRQKWGISSEDEDAKDRYGAKIVPIVSTNCMSAGEALRFIYDEGVINSDFILITGDTVTSINLQNVLRAHNARRKSDKSSIMTMVVKKASTRAERKRLGDADLIVQTDPKTKQLINYEKGKTKGVIKLDLPSCFNDRSELSIRDDIVDCYIDICAPEVLGLFQDNFDYQHLRRDFVTGVLSEEELGNKIFLHELESGLEYAARIHNPRSYDAVSRDIWNHWLSPVEVGQSLVFSTCTHTTGIVRRGMQDVMRDAGVTASRTTKIGSDCQIGSGTALGENTSVSGSFVGKNCTVGKNVEIYSSHVLNGVKIGDGAKIYSSLLSDNVCIEANAVVLEGCIVGSGVVVGSDHTVPSYSRLSLFRQIQEDSDTEEEVEYAGTVGDPAVSGEGSMASEGEDGGVQWDLAYVGEKGRGFLWNQRNMEAAEWRIQSISPCAAALEALKAECSFDVEDDSCEVDVGKPGMEEEDSDESIELDPEMVFHNEVRETFLRCVKERFDQTNALIELNALKIAENRTFADCARFIFTTIVGLCFQAPASVSREYRDLYNPESRSLDEQEARAKLLKHLRSLLNEWGNLLQRFLKNEDDQVEVLLTFEDFCSEDGMFHMENGSMCANSFCQVLQLLYDCDILSEDAIIAWAGEKDNADESDKVFLEKAQPFVTWLLQAESESESSSGSYEDSD